MAEICWFCKKNESNPSTTYEVDLRKTVGEDDTQYGGVTEGMQTVTTTYHYIPAKVLIPRCTSCADAHRNVKNYAFGRGCLAQLISLVLLIVIALIVTRSQGIGFGKMNPLFFLCLCPFVLAIAWVIFNSIAVKKYLKSEGTLPKSYEKSNPEVVKLLALGYKIYPSAEDVEAKVA